MSSQEFGRRKSAKVQTLDVRCWKFCYPNANQEHTRAACSTAK
jgi:hypothetical protein